jgi:hypothetical protein
MGPRLRRARSRQPEPRKLVLRLVLARVNGLRRRRQRFNVDTKLLDARLLRQQLPTHLRRPIVTIERPFLVRMKQRLSALLPQGKQFINPAPDAAPRPPTPASHCGAHR